MLAASNDKDRHKTRVVLAARVTLGVADSEDIEGWFAQNLSAKGIFIQTDHPLPPGADVHVTVTDDGGEVLFEAQATVVWHRTIDDTLDSPPGMGLKFTDVSPEAQAMIDSLVEDGPPESFSPDWPGEGHE